MSAQLEATKVVTIVINATAQALPLVMVGLMDKHPYRHEFEKLNLIHFLQNPKS